jgi:hypothetical protein
MGRSYTSFPPIASMACRGTALLYHLSLSSRQAGLFRDSLPQANCDSRLKPEEGMFLVTGDKLGINCMENGVSEAQNGMYCN